MVETQIPKYPQLDEIARKTEEYFNEADAVCFKKIIKKKSKV